MGSDPLWRERLSSPLLVAVTKKLRPGEGRCGHTLLDQLERGRRALIPTNRQAGGDLILKPRNIYDHRVPLEDGRVMADERMVTDPESDRLVLAVPQRGDAYDGATLRQRVGRGGDDPKVRRCCPVRGRHQEGIATLHSCGHLGGLQQGFRSRQRLQFRLDGRDRAVGLVASAENVAVLDRDRASVRVLPLG